MMSVGDFAVKQILIVIPKEKQKLSIKNENVIVSDADGNVLHQSTCYRLFAVFVIGHIQITDVLIGLSRKFGFSIALFTETFRLHCVIGSTGEANVVLRRKQYSYESLDAAKSLIANKIGNQREMLLSIREKSEYTKSAISMLGDDIAELDGASNIHEIMGVEGSASRVYFKAFFDNVEWKGRKPRIKSDMVNSLLDIGYTVLFAFVECLLRIYGFDCFYGILHRCFYMRKSLVCDMQEPFRVLIDKAVKVNINLGKFKEKHFKIYDGRWLLEYAHSAAYVAVFVKELMERREELFIYIRDFYRAFMRDRCDSAFPVWSV